MLSRALACLAALALAPLAAAQDLAIAPQFEAAGLFHQGAAPVRRDGLWGLIDRDGAVLVEPQFQDMIAGGDGLWGALSPDWGQWGFIDRSGDWTVIPRFDAVGPFTDGLAPVRVGEKWGYVRPDNRMERTPEFLEIGGREGDAISARDAEGWAIFEPSEWRERRPLARSIERPDETWDTLEAERAFSVSERWVVVRDAEGEWLHRLEQPAAPMGFGTRRNWQPGFHSVKRMAQGLAPAATAPGEWGFVDREGRLRWEGRFEDARGFSEGFAPVRTGGLWGYIDRRGDWALAPEWDDAYGFSEGYAIVRRGALRGFLRLDPDRGIVLWRAPEFEDAFRMSEGRAPVRVDGLWGYIAAEDPTPRPAPGVAEIRPE